MMKWMMAGVVVLLLTVVGVGPVHGQIPVTDPGVLAQTIKQVQQMSQQLQQTMQMYNTLTRQYQALAHLPSAALSQIGAQFNAQQYRNPIGVNSGGVGSIMNGTSGVSGSLMQSFLTQNGVSIPPGNGFNAQAMTRSATSVAGVQAMAAALYQSSQNHIQKLQDLQNQLTTAGNDVTAVAQITAQINMEIAVGQYQVLQAQSLAMWQEAQLRNEPAQAAGNRVQELTNAINGNASGITITPLNQQPSDPTAPGGSLLNASATSPVGSSVTQQ